MSIDKLKDCFYEEFGITMPNSFVADKKLVPIAQDGLLLGSEIAVRKQFLAQGYIENFLKDCSEGYYLIGFWGHGLNSYAFYYSRVDSWSKIFFRLPYGGVYMDNDKAAKEVRDFLIAFLEFEKSIRDSVTNFIAVDSMGDGEYKLLYSNGEVVELRRSLFRKPYFSKHLAQKN